MTEDDVTRLARRLGTRAKKRGIDIVTAESCTGGGVVQARRFRFDGNRVEVRLQSVHVAIQGLIDLLR